MDCFLLFPSPCGLVSYVEDMMMILVGTASGRGEEMQGRRRWTVVCQPPACLSGALQTECESLAKILCAALPDP